ncbi:hypothetical protein FHS43_001788 [Streptosporangium becharense]|uniref:Uncharacterized protein n=1 Tax=Streptosporangium becharense TaxID=1816182 RepID=A0A7W9INA2_9ACTN|nr:hypothetical protein [Streptosporangium becharense]MBB2910525.1 hypothetical protein [Streptosporangium becharense]MBB5823268.1 hypothetical protein [Streptosporangium becharense]
MFPSPSASVHNGPLARSPASGLTGTSQGVQVVFTDGNGSNDSIWRFR